MKILHIGKYYSIKGGMETAINDIVQYMSSKKIRCDLICIDSMETCVIKENDYCCIRVFHEDLRFSSASISFKLLREIRNLVDEYDIVHIHCPNPVGNLALLFSGFKGKIVVHWHSDIIKQKKLLKVYKYMQSWLLKRADLIIATSAPYLQFSPFIAEFKDKAMVLPLGVSQVSPSSKSVDKIKQCHSGKRIILGVGRLVYYKGFRFLIEALSYLGPEYVLLLVGTGPCKQELEMLIKKHALSHRCFLLGSVSDEELHNLYGACDVFCLPSCEKTEAFGLVQIEAMSCGKPVVATNIEGSGVPWVNQHGVSGKNVKPCCAMELADAIRDIIEDENKYQEYSENARNRYLTYFAKEKILPQYEDIYKRLLADRG